jgi:hypothetical protein
MANDPAHSPAASPAQSWLRRWLIAGLAIAGCLVLSLAVGAGGVLWWLRTRHVTAMRAVEAEVSRIRAAGEPITTEDAYAFHRIADGADDCTPQWLAAFEAFDSRQLTLDGKDLPIVGLPAAGEDPRSAPPMNLQSSQLAAAESFLDKYEAALAAAHLAAKAPGDCDFPVRFEDGFQAELPHVSKLRQLARLLSLQLRVRAARGDADGALECLEALVAASRTMDGRLSAVDFLTGVALGGVACREAEFLLNNSAPDDSQLARLQRAISRLDPKGNLPPAMLGERAMGFHAYLNMGSLDSEKNSSLDRYNGQLIRPVDCQKYLQVLRDLVDCSHLPFPEARNKARLVDVEMKALMTNRIQQLSYITTLLLAPAVPAVFDSCAQSAARRDAVLTAIAAERSRLRTGKYPSRLEELVPDFLPEIPHDPFDGKPLRWIAQDAGVAIYSIGSDGKDDLGQSGPHLNEPDVVVSLSAASEALP